MKIFCQNKIIHGDCIEKMQKLPSECVDFILTDPPYLVNYQDKDKRTIKNDIFHQWVFPAYKEMYRLLKPKQFCVSFYGWNSIDEFMYSWKAIGFRIIGHIVWKKEYSSNSKYLKYQHECAYLLSKGIPDLPVDPLPSVLPWKYSKNSLHPTQKSVEILKPLIKQFSKHGDIVLDPFAGSGSTAIASLSLGRNFVCYEMDRKYHATSVKRTIDYYNKLKLSKEDK